MRGRRRRRSSSPRPLPERLRDYIGKGDRLFEKVVRFDRLERGGIADYPESIEGGIADQLARLKAAFGRLRE